MPSSLYLNHARRVVLAQFRSVAPNPTNRDARKPLLDARGAAGSHPWPVVGATAGDTFIVKVFRPMESFPLFVSSENDSVVSVRGASLSADGRASSLTDGALPGGDNNVFVTLRAGRVRAEQSTHVRVHAVSADGPVLAQLVVRVFSPITIPIKATVVTVSGGADAPGATPSFTSVRSILDRVQAYWSCAGVRIDYPSSIPNGNATGASADVVSTRDELRALLGEFREAGKLAVIFVERLRIAGEFDTGRDTRLGFGFPPGNSAAMPAGIVIAASTARAGGEPYSDDERAQVIAHEMGHFFGLTHPAEHDELDEQSDHLWTQRRLMHPEIRPLPRDGWPDRGHGCAGLVTQKPAWTGDVDEATAVRTALGPDAFASRFP